MNWIRRQDELARELSPDVARFVVEVLKSLEQANVFDAPGVISGVVCQMRVADSAVIRCATGRTERLLKSAFARRCLQRMGA
ncbi:MAG TPA: hypothetical protein VD902_20250 [Symbiobacteriaceae bacterium]|nr:hypothetical protein [Symbiobacteriaceae bacterium]